MQLQKVQLGGFDRTNAAQINVAGAGFRVAGIFGAGTQLDVALTNSTGPFFRLYQGLVMWSNFGSLWLKHLPIAGAGYMVLQVFDADEWSQGEAFPDADAPFHTKGGGVFSTDLPATATFFNIAGIANPAVNGPLNPGQPAVSVVTSRIGMCNPGAAALDIQLQRAPYLEDGSAAHLLCQPWDLSRATNGTGCLTRSINLQQTTQLTGRVFLEAFTVPAGGIIEVPRRYVIPPGVALVLAAQTVNVEMLATFIFDEYPL